MEKGHYEISDDDMGMRTIEGNLQVDNPYTLTLVIRFLNRLVLLQFEQVTKPASELVINAMAFREVERKRQQ